MSFSDGTGLNLKKFVSQDEVDEKRKERQAEWEKVRKPEDPEEFPEEPVDNRCLYDKLEEQRLKKQEEFEEKVAFRNQVRRLDEDETEFLDFVTETQQEVNKARNQEEAAIISELQSAKVVRIEDQKPEEKKGKPVISQSNKKSQLALLAGAVKRKGSEEKSPPKKQRTSSETNTVENKNANNERSENLSNSSKSGEAITDRKPSNAGSKVAKVIGILPAALPGLTHYEDSSDSMSSSSDSDVDFPLQGRSNVCMLIKQNLQNQH